MTDTDNQIDEILLPICDGIERLDRLIEAKRARAAIKLLVLKERQSAYKQLIRDVTKPETIGAHFLHAEVEEFAKQLEEYLNGLIKSLEEEMKGLNHG